jgi:hypothetical protein
MILFVSNSGLLSKETTKTVTLDLINLRDALFEPSDYYYDIMRWKTISLSYGSRFKDISDQKLELLFRRPVSETSSISIDVLLDELFLGTPIINSLTIYDFDNGTYRIAEEFLIEIDPGIQIATDLPSRPVSLITGGFENLTAIIANPEAWKVGYAVRIKSGTSLLEPAVTITDINLITGEITFSAPIIVQNPKQLKLASPNNTLYEVIVTDEGVLTTEPTTGSPSPLFRVLADKEDELDPDVYYSLVVDNNGVLGVLEDTSLKTIDNLFELQSDNEDMWLLSFDSKGRPTTSIVELTLVGKSIVFAPNDELVLEQLIDFNDV